jgi:hypothetical protein
MSLYMCLICICICDQECVTYVYVYVTRNVSHMYMCMCHICICVCDQHNSATCMRKMRKFNGFKRLFIPVYYWKPVSVISICLASRSTMQNVMRAYNAYDVMRKIQRVRFSFLFFLCASCVVCAHAQPCTCLRYIHTQSDTYIHSPIHTYTVRLIRAHAHVYTHLRTHIHTHTYAQYMKTDSRAKRNMPTHTNTNRHIHTQNTKHNNKIGIPGCCYVIFQTKSAPF